MASDRSIGISTVVQILGTSIGLALPALAQEAIVPVAPEGGHFDHLTGVVGDLGVTVITATMSPRAVLDIPYSMDVISAERILERGYRTTPQALRDTPGVMIQETAAGHGSPYIRGFTSYRNLFLIDGIRLNNSVFRDGPNQYWNTVDPYSISSMEVIKGPASVLYGSDAIGGLVNVRTKNPDLGGDVTGELLYRYSSAEDSNILRAEVGVSPTEDWGVLVGMTGKSFGDMRGGSDTGNQPYTGYDEFDADLKLLHNLGADARLTLGFQHVNQNNVPRTHRTIYAVPFEGTGVGSDLRRDFDQDRTLAYAQVDGYVVGSFFDEYHASLSWHNQSEIRHRTRSNGNEESQGFDVDTVGILASMGSETEIGRLTYGFDYYTDSVDSFKEGDPIQGPVGDDATYDLLGVYLQNEIEVNQELNLIFGGRFNYAAADAKSVKDPLTSNKIQVKDDWTAFVGSARLIYELVPEETNLFGGISQGFRAPNLSDLTRFDSARTNEFEIATPDLDAERSISYEVGLKTERKQVSGEVAVFYTEIEEQIVRFPTGNTNGSGEFEITKDNVGDGYVFGVELGGAWDLGDEVTVFGNGTYQYGKVDTYASSAQLETEEYISRLMPFMAQLGVRWEFSGPGKWIEADGVYAAKADKLSTRDAGDTSRIPPGGTPSYLVLGLRGAWRFNQDVTLFAGLENLTNEDYRVHGSGSNSPGFGVRIGIRLSL